MGLFRHKHKKHVYVFWCRYSDAENVAGGNAVIRSLNAEGVALTINKLTGEKFKKDDIRILHDFLDKSFSRPMTESYARKIVPEAWKIATEKYGDEMFDESKDIPCRIGLCDTTVIPNLEPYGLFLLFVEA